MAVDKTEAGNPFAALIPHQFVQLTTFRKSGVAVPTTVWFAPDAGKLYVMTTASTGKIKRIRNNGRMLLAPSDRSGKVLGPALEGTARELPASEHERASAVLARKYGLSYRAFMLFGRLRKVTRVFIEISPA
jgi:PPOX class probable F420-dependent enzyme